GSIYACITHGKSIAVATDGEVHDREYTVFSNILDAKDRHPGFNAHTVAYGNQYFHRGVTRPSAKACAGRIDTGSASCDGRNGCSGQLIPDTVLSFSSATTGAIPPLKAWGRS